MPKTLAQLVHRPCASEVLFETCVAMKFVGDNDDDGTEHILTIIMKIKSNTTNKDVFDLIFIINVLPT